MIVGFHVWVQAPLLQQTQTLEHEKNTVFVLNGLEEWYKKSYSCFSSLLDSTLLSKKCFVQSSSGKTFELVGTFGCCYA